MGFGRKKSGFRGGNGSLWGASEVTPLAVWDADFGVSAGATFTWDSVIGSLQLAACTANNPSLVTTYRSVKNAVQFSLGTEAISRGLACTIGSVFDGDDTPLSVLLDWCLGPPVAWNRALLQIIEASSTSIRPLSLTQLNSSYSIVSLYRRNAAGDTAQYNVVNPGGYFLESYGLNPSAHLFNQVQAAAQTSVDASSVGAITGSNTLYLANTAYSGCLVRRVALAPAMTSAQIESVLRGWKELG